MQDSSRITLICSESPSKHRKKRMADILGIPINTFTILLLCLPLISSISYTGYSMYVISNAGYSLCTLSNAAGGTTDVLGLILIPLFIIMGGRALFAAATTYPILGVALIMYYASIAIILTKKRNTGKFIPVRISA